MSEVKEVWKDVKDYEGLYQVSNLGRVKSLPRTRRNNTGEYYTKEIILKYGFSKQGYLRVVLNKFGVNKSFRINRLVAETFIPNPNDYPIVNHKDEIKDNNNADNLEWCTHKYNINYGTRNKKVAKKLSRVVYQYTLDGYLLNKWHSLAECSLLGFDTCHISACCKNKRRTHKGYIWSYERRSDINA